MVKELSGLLVMFAVSGRRLAVSADAIASIVPEPALLCPPQMPTVLAGVFQLRGRLVPVMRPDRLLDLAAPAPGPFRVLLVFVGAHGEWALLAERALAVVEAGELAPVPADSSFDDCVIAMRPMVDGPVPVLSAARLLRRHEAAALAEFTARAQQRWEDFALGHA